MRADLFLFIGILILIFAAWAASGGPSRPISFAGPYLNPIQQTGTAATPYGDPSRFSSINSTVSVGTAGVSASPGTAWGGQKVVSLSRDSFGAKNTDEDQEYVIVSVSYGASGPVSTAGWRLVSEKTGKGAVFPQGADVIRTGRVNQLTPITLLPGEQATVVSGRSPVGLSFRENKCTGYLEEHQDFKPPLMMNCPTPWQEFNRYYDGSDDECEFYVSSIPYCSTETATESDVSSSCERFIERHLTQNGCVDAHGGDPDFKGNTWRVFLGARDELWRREGEVITLLDAEGKVIDSLSY